MVVLRERYMQTFIFLIMKILIGHDIYVPEHPKQVAQETRKTELWQERQRKGQAVCICTAQEESCKKM